MRRHLRAVLLCCVVLIFPDTVGIMGQNSGTSSSSPSQDTQPPPASTSQTPAPQPTQKEAGKSRKRKRKDKNQAAPDEDSQVFSTAVITDLLEDVRDGLEGRNRRLLLSAFDGDQMTSYVEFLNQIEGLFNAYDTVNVYFRVTQATTEGTQGIALVEAQMEEKPRSQTTAPVRKNQQLRFVVEHGLRGWKIVDVQPRGFFS